MEFLELSIFYLLHDKFVLTCLIPYNFIKKSKELCVVTIEKKTKVFGALLVPLFKNYF